MGDFTVIDGQYISNDLIRVLDLIEQGDLVTATANLTPHWRGCVEKAVLYSGFRLLGQGVYSTVFQVPGSDTVIKMNHEIDDRWSLYAKYAKQNAMINPMLPKVFELHEHPDNGMVIARVEKLDSIKFVHTIGMRDVVTCLKGDLQHGQMSKRGVRNKTLKYLRDKFDFGYKGSYSAINLAKIVLWMTHTIRDNDYVDVDCHHGNWMLRGNELVLNDPLSV